MRFKGAVAAVMAMAVVGFLPVGCASANTARASVPASAETGCVYVSYFYSHALGANGPYVYENAAGQWRLEPRYRGSSIKVPVCA